MTLVSRSTMRVQKRYRAAHFNKNNRSMAVIIASAIFLISFALYQIASSNSNEGREAVRSTNGFFLKGGSLPLDSVDYTFNGDHSVKRNQIETHEREQGQQSVEENEVEVSNLVMKRHQSVEENKVKIQRYQPVKEDNEAISKSIMQHDPIQNEVKFRDVFGDQDEGVTVAAVASPLQEDSKEDMHMFDTDHIMFHNYYNGKSEKVVEEMLIAHAYIFQQNKTYGGCCGNRGPKMTSHEDLLDVLGLKNVVRFRCPRDFVQDTKTHRSVIPRDRYMSEDTHVWTPEYVDYLRTLVTYPERQRKDYTIVVHMVRGNASPCKEKSRGFQSYLPNLHYQNLIDKYMKPGARVVIYTSAKSFESLSQFRNRGYEINSGTSLKEMWKDFVTADVFIMSRSDFSMVPAMVAKGIVVYTPFWHHSLRQWKRVSRSIMKESDRETIRLQESKCIFGLE